jgi:tRNA pseudouridine65 synthase
MLPVLYQDDHLIAIHKPAGLLVHRSVLDVHETRFAVQLLRDQVGRHVFPAHRLDRGTSGVLLFAFDRETLVRLSSAFEQRAISKRYMAIVRGHPPMAGLIDHPLSRRHDETEHRHQDASAAPQPALTRFRTLATTELPYRVDRYPSSRYALLELHPESGRRHQLRRHLKHISHPIIGDSTFGKGRHNRLFQHLFGTSRMLLASTLLELSHPWSGAPLRLCAPPDQDFMQVAAPLGWRTAALDSLSSVIET